ncbi:MAG: RNA 2',3'-cyclic phosphodiesterase [Desulfotomaculum sp.]|nr:RNA 2',3'-cyclic phosphodiesterase [Desulfotomaculum sp.]
MPEMRLFIAINLPSALKMKLKELQQQLAGCNCWVKWVKPENFHLTIKFLGETDIKKILAINSRLQKICQNVGTFQLKFTKLGTFPKANLPKVLWVGVEGNIDVLRNLNQQVEEEMQSIGFSRDKRRFSPHLTLGRVKNSHNCHELLEKLSVLNKEGINFGTVEVKSMELMRSVLKKDGPVYSVVEQFRFM